MCASTDTYHTDRFSRLLYYITYSRATDPALASGAQPDAAHQAIYLSTLFTCHGHYALLHDELITELHFLLYSLIT